MDYQTQHDRFFQRLAGHPYMVLATCSQDRPLACTMTCVTYDGAVWMQTDGNFLKCKQMRENPRVALCAHSIQVEGIVEFCGHPLDPANGTFARIFGERFPDTLERYAAVPSQVLLKVTPLLATDWLYEAGSQEIIQLDFTAQTVQIERYVTK